MEKVLRQREFTGGDTTPLSSELFTGSFDSEVVFGPYSGSTLGTYRCFWKDEENNTYIPFYLCGAKVYEVGLEISYELYGGASGGGTRLVNSEAYFVPSHSGYTHISTGVISVSGGQSKSDTFSDVFELDEGIIIEDNIRTLYPRPDSPGYNTNAFAVTVGQAINNDSSYAKYSGLILTVYYEVLPPTVNTYNKADKIGNKYKVYGVILKPGGETCSRRGFIWKVGGTPEIDDYDGIVSQTGVFGNYILEDVDDVDDFDLALEKLPSDVTIYYRAFAENPAGIGYGETQEIYVEPSNMIVTTLKAERVSPLVAVRLYGEIEENE